MFVASLAKAYQSRIGRSSGARRSLDMSIEQELAELKATVGYIKDRMDILDCIQSESRARDRQDVEQIAGCWWEDGVDEHGAVVVHAPEYPERANAGHQAGFQQTSHNITNHLCELDGDTAYCESYVVGGLLWKDGEQMSLGIGRYLDQLERRNGEWRILTRRCTIEMTGNADASWLKSPEVKGFLKGLWSKEDPSYERPIIWTTADKGVRW
jgi:hypothetical protein